MIMMDATHKHPIAGFMTRCTFSLFRDPTAVFEVAPLVAHFSVGRAQMTF